MAQAVAFFAVTTRGLEDVSAAEITTVPGVLVTHVAYRRILGSCSISLDGLRALRTVDDVFVSVLALESLGPRRAALAHLRSVGREPGFSVAVEAIGRMRALSAPPTFSATASFVGARKYTSAEIK
jgi:hypothetical protein